MNKFVRLAPLGIIVLALALILIVGRNFLDSKLPVLGGSYYKDFKSDAELEYKYSQMGEYSVDSKDIETTGEDMGNITVWYPKGVQEKFPMIIVVNPTKVMATQYKAFFTRLASWGFVVVGNDDTQSGSGKGTSMTLDAMLDLVETHPLREVIDYDKIGLIGYSQGGAGALAAASEYDNASYYKAIFTGSAICHELADDYSWIYDTSKITVPCFMTAGTGDTDSGNDEEDITGACPYVSLMDNYDAISQDVIKIRARAVGAEHNEMLTRCDGYMTAWMLYQLKGDKDAAAAFEGDSAEILSNANWQDVEKNQ